MQQTQPNALIRCAWAETNELLLSYHDIQWGVPVHDDRLLFEMLNLEGAQAGLSWLTILRKRKNYQWLFDNFKAEKIATYDNIKVQTLLSDEGIIRNRLKINAVIQNAQAFLALQREFDSFNAYIWKFVNYETITDSKKQNGLVISEQMSKELKKCGFKFVGRTICYAFMQAVGMINDHELNCAFR